MRLALLSLVVFVAVIGEMLCSQNLNGETENDIHVYRYVPNVRKEQIVHWYRSMYRKKKASRRQNSDPCPGLGVELQNSCFFCHQERVPWRYSRRNNCKPGCYPLTVTDCFCCRTSPLPSHSSNVS